MGSPQRISSAGALVLAPLIAALGVLLVARTLAAGGGVLSLGVLAGAIFIAIGLARLHLARRTAPGRGGREPGD